MSRLLALFVLCGMCISVFSDADLKDCIFDFLSFESEGNSDDLILDFSGLGISTLTEGSTSYRYLTGEFKTRSKVDSSIQVGYSITKIGDMPFLGFSNACYYSANIFPQYLKPIAGMRGDAPIKIALCDRDPSTIIHLAPANSSKDLVAGSKLDQGNYFYEVVFLKNDNVVGGMKGQFNLIPV